MLQSLLAVNVSAVINFLPQLLSQLFHLLTRTSSEDVAMNAVRQVLDTIFFLHFLHRLHCHRLSHIHSFILS